MIDLKKQIEAVFGRVELPHGLFYEFDSALRFELNGEGDIAMKREALIDLYRSRQSWLLKYDMARMKSIFEKA